MADDGVSDRVKVENFILVTLKLRPCSRMNLPAELPAGESLGRQIDELVLPKLSRLQSETDPYQRLVAIDSIKRDMRDAFKSVVLSSENYNDHLKWVKSLGLRSRLDSVRPTLSELYLYNNWRTGSKLKKLMREREKLRSRARKNATPSMDRARFAYPEEFEASWLKEMGNILGYPECCIDAYASDREEGVNVERRASQQLEEMEGRTEVDPKAYFLGYFFPCAPDCVEASTRGREIHERLRAVSQELGDLYSKIVADNMTRVRSQPDLISDYQKRADGLR